MDGVLRCSRYAFGPNRLHYCGPDQNREMLDYLKEDESDPGLRVLLGAFETMFPYLNFIAHENKIKDPFDDRVVEAYWIGNNLLDKIEKKTFWRHLDEMHKIPKRIGKKDFEIVSDKIRQGAVPHHSFHVFSIWKRTGHFEEAHTLKSMDSCRVSWGEVKEVSGPAIKVLTEPLILNGCKLMLGKPVSKKISRNLETSYDIEQLKSGDIISIHWNVPCEVISPLQAEELKKYTLRHIALANQAI
ncbi:hypothetical protein HYW53_02215 [Candidatus Giovannonibacteria bacterium]|nr:hypothetical protein [Candidatus Giovannonibacteria bacterium]